MRLLIWVSISLINLFPFGNPSWAQDERTFRKLLTGGLVSEQLEKVETPVYVYEGTNYRFDLDSNGIDETLQVIKKDGINWLHIYDSSERQLFAGKLWAMGGDSKLYRVKIVDLSPRHRVLVLFLYEGKTESVRFEATARLFFLSLDDKKFASFKLYQGPHYFHEREAIREQYWNKQYSVNIKDFDHDGIKDISVQYNHIQRVYIYKGKGEWRRF